MNTTETNLELLHEAFIKTHAKHVQEVGLALCHTGKLQCAYRLAGFNFFQRCTRPVHAIVLWILYNQLLVIDLCRNVPERTSWKPFIVRLVFLLGSRLFLVVQDRCSAATDRAATPRLQVTPGPWASSHVLSRNQIALEG